MITDCTLTLVQRKRDPDFVDVYGTNGNVTIAHIDTFHQGDLSVYHAIMTGEDVKVKLVLDEE